MYQTAVVLSILVVLVDGSCLKNHTAFVPHLDGKIRGGSDTSIEQHPYHVSVEYYGSHICSGSLLTPSKALTAAHCTERTEPQGYKVRAGSTYRELGGQLANVQTICINPRYNPQTMDGDSSVLVLATPFILMPTIQTVPLIPLGAEIRTGSYGVSTGWSSNLPGGPLVSLLQRVEIPKISSQECRKVYGNNAVKPTMICFGCRADGKDACQGDSGGPVVQGGVQVGILSWGIGCGSLGYPSVFVNTADYTIQSHIFSCY